MLSRLDAHAQAIGRGNRQVVSHPHSCQECGAAGAASAGGFCCDACRKAFNNRRLTRGAELYDLFMVARFDRPLAKVMKVWGMLARLASGWRDEDRRLRDGRKSWRHPGSSSTATRRSRHASSTAAGGRRDGEL